MTKLFHRMSSWSRTTYLSMQHCGKVESWKIEFNVVNFDKLGKAQYVGKNRDISPLKKRISMSTFPLKLPHSSMMEQFVFWASMRRHSLIVTCTSVMDRQQSLLFLDIQIIFKQIPASIFQLKIPHSAIMGQLFFWASGRRHSLIVNRTSEMDRQQSLSFFKF